MELDHLIVKIEADAKPMQQALDLIDKQASSSLGKMAHWGDKIGSSESPRKLTMSMVIASLDIQLAGVLSKIMSRISSLAPAAIVPAMASRYTRATSELS